MSEVKNYASDPCNSRFVTWVAVKHGGSELGEVVIAQDFDRVTAERDAALERVTELEGLLRTWRNGCDMTVEAWGVRRDKTDAALKPAEPPLPEGWYGVDCEENNREPGITVRFYPAVQLGSGFDIYSYGCAEGVPRPMTFISMSDHKCPNKSYAVKEITRGTKSPCGILVNGVIYYCEGCKP